jgi:hypothetical protein
VLQRLLEPEQWSLFVVADDREPFTGVQARRFAAMILQAADELDRLAGAWGAG